MSRVFCYFIIIFSISETFLNSYAQGESDSLDFQVKTRGKIIDRVSEEIDSTQTVITDFSILEGFKLESNSFFGTLVVPSEEQVNVFKSRGIPNASEKYKENVKSIVLLVSPDYSSMGSGCIVTEEGEIMTNYHVIRNFDKMLAFYYDVNITKLEDIDPENFKIAEVIAAIPEKDLALLKITENQKCKVLRFADNSSIDIGQEVFAIGDPETNIWSFTSGVISQLRNNYEWSYDNLMKCKANVIQTQTPINPGNSGGPLFDVNGNLIGLNSFRTKEAEGLNFAIRIDEIEKFLKEANLGEHRYYNVASKDKTHMKINWNRIDSNGNGIIDCEVADSDGNGIIDTGRMDENEDGYIDYIVFDFNQNGMIDVYVYDSNEDGQFEYFILDTDFDGYLDTVGVDINGDGSPDEFDNYD